MAKTLWGIAVSTTLLISPLDCFQSFLRRSPQKARTWRPGDGTRLDIGCAPVTCLLQAKYDDNADDMFVATARNGVKTNRTVNGTERRSSQSRSRRSVDFPSFAYDAKTRVRSGGGPKQSVKVSVCFDDECTSSTILAGPKMERSEPLSTIILRSIFGPTFEAGLSDTERLLPTAIQTRLLTDRAYARREPFEAENVTAPPSLDDLAARTREPFEGFWISDFARILYFTVSYLAFPVLTKFLDAFVTMPPEQLDSITGKFAPGVSILYGTFISLTLSILYNRQREIQDNVALECALLVDVTRVLLSLFKDDPERAVDAGQCAADQIRTLVRSSRGAELMLLMYSDVYARMLELVDAHEDEMFRNQGVAGRSTTRISYSRDLIKDLYKVRAQRLSDESLALPPTHFLILNTLTVLILLGYTISILPTVALGTGEPSNESSLLFGFLTTTYIIFYYFASDLNNPFRGVYQVRRSCAASHLLEAKWLIANHPLLRGKVDFDEVYESEGPSGSISELRSPGLGEYYFIRENVGDEEIVDPTSSPR